MRRNGSDSIKHNTPIRKTDILLILMFLLVALMVYVVMNSQSEKGDYVQITVNGMETGTYSLNENKVIPISGVDGSNTLLIENGKVSMKDADCPDKICVKHKAIEKTGETIVCLPHKVVVEIVSEGQKTTQKEYDMMTQ